MQARQDQFDAGDLFFRVLVDRHAAAIIDDFQGPVAAQLDVDALAMAGNGLIDAVIDDLMGQVIGPGNGIRIHPRPAANGIQPAQHLDIGGVVILTH